MTKSSKADVKVVAFDQRFADRAVPWLAQLYPDANDMEAVRRHAVNIATSPANDLYGVEVNGVPAAIIGILEQNPIERSASLMVISDPVYQGKGLGRPVTAWLLDVLKGGRFVLLRAFCTNLQSKNMLRKVGFREIKVPGTLMEYRYV